jgi:hypothetical protein
VKLELFKVECLSRTRVGDERFGRTEPRFDRVLSTFLHLNSYCWSFGSRFPQEARATPLEDSEARTQVGDTREPPAESAASESTQSPRLSFFLTSDPRSALGE